MIKTPESLVPVGSRQRVLSGAKALFYFEDSPNQTLEIFKKPFRFSSGKSGVSLFPEEAGGMRMDNLGWYVRQSPERDNDLWEVFLENQLCQN
tara:strand:- start:28184 stop:28462 length:279 start_codon:yes stop_codon:yes gene_type:complete